MSLLGIFSIICTCIQGIKETTAPTIPAENWANKELYHKDLMNGVSVEQRMKNLKNGKYKLTEAYPEPHKDNDGKIHIENCQLYDEDLIRYGAVQAMKWVKQGKYNLNASELRMEKLRIEKKFLKLYAPSSGLTNEEKNRLEEIDKITVASNFDYKNTEGLRLWRKADKANNG